MRKALFSVVAAATLTVGAVAPAQAAGFAANKSWTHGAQGIEAFANSATCEFMETHTKPMQIHTDKDYAANKEAMMRNAFVRDYMDRRINEGAGDHAKMVSSGVRTMLIDLGILAVLNRAVECHVIADPSGMAAADLARLKAEGNKKYGSIDPVGVISEVPKLLSSFSS